VDVRIVDFPETRIAVLEHRGPPEQEYETVRRLVEWRLANRLHPDRHRSYGIHYNDPGTTPPADYRVDFGISVEHDVRPNPQGVRTGKIPGGRCALARHLGSRERVTAALYLYDVWLPASGESLRDFPVFFHYVNVGPHVEIQEMITDVYLPLR
jgi:AraC family transcriptional regulator